MKNLVIVGGGFAGVWAAMSAARTRQRAANPSEIPITLVSRDSWLTIRPRLYEASLDGLRVPLDDLAKPLGITRVEGSVTQIAPISKVVVVASQTGQRVLPYDRLILAAGSRLNRPVIPGIARAFSVDTFAEAEQLERHIERLPTSGDVAREGRFTAVVVGAGFTGIEVATALIERLQRSASIDGTGERARVVLVERDARVAPDLGPDARRHVEPALTTLGIESRVGATVSAVEAGGVRLVGGEWIPAGTVVWTGGFRANPLTEQLSVERDASGRVPVDRFLRIEGMDGIYAAGDVARVMADSEHVAPMSCQFAIPTGERAGENAMRSLLGLPHRPFEQPDYVTCLDLGDAGAIFMEGWDRQVKLTGSWGKLMKRTINERLIYPPRLEPTSGSVSAIDRRRVA